MRWTFERGGWNCYVVFAFEQHFSRASGWDVSRVDLGCIGVRMGGENMSTSLVEGTTLGRSIRRLTTRDSHPNHVMLIHTDPPCPILSQRRQCLTPSPASDFEKILPLLPSTTQPDPLFSPLSRPLGPTLLAHHVGNHRGSNQEYRGGDGTVSTLCVVV
jgi:hypothetical protein